MIEAADLGTKRHAFRADGAMARFVKERARERGALQPAVSNSVVTSGDVNGLLELFEPIPTSSGYAVTDYTAMLVSTLYACLTKIAGPILQLPVHEYMVGVGQADRQPVLPRSPLWWMLNEQPTVNWTAASWKEWIVKCVHLRGDQHTEILRSDSASAGGAIKGLRPHHPDCVSPRYYKSLSDEIRLAYDIYDPARDAYYTVDQDDMLHFSGFGFDGRRSLSVVQYAARNALGNELGASDFLGKSVASGALPKLLLKTDTQLNNEQKRALREDFVAVYGGGPLQKQFPLVLGKGADAIPLRISPVDLQLLESRKLNKGQICEACGVPPVIIGDSEKTTSWGTGVEQIVIGFVKFTIQPHLVRWSEELNRKLYRRAGRYVEFELDALLAGDSKAQAEAFRQALGGPGTGDGWMSTNEVRRLKNLPRLEGDEYDKPYRAPRDAGGAPAKKGTP